jgi:hypothetical protein
MVITSPSDSTAPRVEPIRLRGFKITDSEYLAFASQCRRDERTASATLRWLIRRYMAEAESREAA